MNKRKISRFISLFFIATLLFTCCDTKNASDSNYINPSHHIDTKPIKISLTTPTPKVNNLEDESTLDEETAELVEVLELYEDSYATLDELKCKKLLSIFSETFEDDLIKIARGHDYCQYVLVKIDESNSINQLSLIEEYEGFDISAYIIQNNSFILIIFADEIYSECNVNRLLNSLWPYENSDDYHHLIKIKKNGGFDRNQSGCNLKVTDFRYPSFYLNDFDFNDFYSKYSSIKKDENKQSGWFACIGISIYDTSKVNSNEIIEIGLMQDGSKSVNGYKCDVLFDEIVSFVETNSFWYFDSFSKIQNIMSAELFLDNKSVSIIDNKKRI